MVSKYSSYAALMGWGVGVPAWLDNKESKVWRYWRIIENGSGNGAPQRVVGLWGNRAEPRGGLITGQLDQFGESGSQKFVPFYGQGQPTASLKAAHAALYYFFGGGRGPNMALLEDYAASHHPQGTHWMSNGKMRSYGSPRTEAKHFYWWLMTQAKVEQIPFVTGVIRRKVEARHFYRDALAQFDPAQHEMDALRREFSGVGNPSTTAGLRKIRAAEGASSGNAPKAGRRRRYSTAPQFGQMPVATMAASVTLQDMTRGSGGRFASGTIQSIVRRVNQEVATAFQAEVVSLMQNAERKRLPTKDLIKATQDSRNRAIR